MHEKNILTDKELWAKEIEKLELPVVLNRDIRSDRIFIKIFEQYFSTGDGSQKKVLEIGCNPGKFLIYFKQYLKFNISGIDYDEIGCAITKENLKSANISGNIKIQDILSYKTKEKFDVVLSCGFIEHFKNDVLKKVLKTHLELLNTNGKLFLSVPNFRYFNYIAAYLLRRGILKFHNLEVMQKSFLESFAEENNLNIEFIAYFGGIHIGGIKFNKNNKLKWLINELVFKRYEKSKIFDKVNSKYFSHHLGAIFTKK